MVAISLKLDDETLKETQEIVLNKKLSRDAYINEAVRLYNSLNRRQDLKEQLLSESKRVAENSMEILAELEKLT